MPEKPPSSMLDNAANPSPLSPACHRGVSAPYLPLVYRAEIDGLRAIAVLAVVFFHVGLSCPGGFVGVDVFFVISGYLITALLLREFQEGRFSLAGFWERRVRRIFPAGAIMVLVTLLAGGLLLLPTDFEKLGWSAMAQSMMGSNLFFWRQEGGYFAEYEIQPLLHTWSLAVEEQFYVFLPLLLLLLHRKTLARPVMLRCLFGLAIAISLTLAVALLPEKGRAVFYLLPTRAWELLVGSMVAAFSPAWLISRRWIREVVAWLGLAGILLPIFLYSRQTLFPGLAALPPCLGAGAIIWSNIRADSGQAGMPTVLGRLLALRPIVFIGLISYSLYIWHWPLLAFLNYERFNFDIAPLPTKLLTVMAAFCLGIVSWRLVEVPFRKKRLEGSRNRVLGIAGAATALLMFLSGSVAMLSGFPSRVSESTRQNDLARTDRGFREAVATKELLAGRLPRLESQALGGLVKILLWGDSHAMHTVDALETLCLRRGWTLDVVSYPATAPVVADFFSCPEGLSENAPAWADAVLLHVGRVGIKEVVLAANWGYYQSIGAERLEKALRATICRLHASGCRVWVLQDVPDFDVAVPFGLIGESDDGIGRPHDGWRRTGVAHRQRNSVVYGLAEEGLPAVFMDPAPTLLSPMTGLYRADADGVSLYFDRGHLTARGSLQVLLPVLEEAMGNALARRIASPSPPSATE